ncbi:hypothetical protein PghCCS26_62680 [Paenibacillus glycanilyticus]|uniref:Uncharacterized protein n=1 Tax=Paenibacillus glycanilyticus TaxID=126569 RepID=A0ABQ6NVL1_9BACL|nr:hypothetical protein [Paenibacillus glycanilyticus]GMK49138.1 hypothetical protein PghCCS26_62680 [Paenibacillus glycanilyticus]
MFVLQSRIDAAQKVYDDVKAYTADPIRNKLHIIGHLISNQYDALYLYAFLERASDQQIRDLAQGFPAEVYVFLKDKGRLYNSGLINFSVFPR